MYRHILFGAALELSPIGIVKAPPYMRPMRDIQWRC